MKFKGEIFMLLTAIALFAASAFLYSMATTAQGLTASSAPEFPYQGYAFSLVGLGSLLMVTASLSFLKRSKPPMMHVPKRISAKNCTD
jgi:hypothetical protein